ncbi:hypothetical protein CRV24_005152 [Beauveria bassiana]|nr:hypothetical protein CRV24_005152 [Beauveria bassiana]
METPRGGCAKCGLPVIWLWGQNGARRLIRQPLSALDLEQHDECFALVFVEANNISKCKVCKLELAERFSVPTFWWENYCKSHNGYFGSQDIMTDGNTNAGLEPENKYTWTKLNIMTYARATNNQIMLVFDAEPKTQTTLLDSLMPRSETTN